MVIKGSCCCGAIRFELTEAPAMMGACHCSRCRKLGASPMVFVARDTFRLTRGADAIATFAAHPPYTYNRTFCRVCGTALGEIGSRQDTFPIAAHCLDDDPGIGIAFHEFVADKPHWVHIGDDAPQFSDHPVIDQPGIP